MRCWRRPKRLLLPVEATEAAALGAGLLAGPAGGAWTDVADAAARIVQTGTPVDPQIGLKLPGDLDRFRRLYPALRNA